MRARRVHPAWNELAILLPADAVLRREEHDELARRALRAAVNG